MWARASVGGAAGSAVFLDKMAPLRREPVVVAKHMLLVAEDGRRQVHLCDVTSWDDSKQVEHGISGKLEVNTRRFTPSKLINHLPKFRLTLSASARADTARLLPFLVRLRKDAQVQFLYVASPLLLHVCLQPLLCSRTSAVVHLYLSKSWY